MNNQILDRIIHQLELLRKQKEVIVQQIREIKKKEEHTKYTLHQSEFKIFTDGLMNEDERKAASAMMHHVNELRHERHDLHEEEHQIKKLTQQLHDIEKQISHVDYWMRYASPDDAVKQGEAERRIFG